MGVLALLGWHVNELLKFVEFLHTTLLLPFDGPSSLPVPLRRIELAITMSKTYSTSDVASHNKGDNLWIIVDEDVYDLTKFQDEHPGMLDLN